MRSHWSRRLVGGLSRRRASWRRNQGFAPEPDLPSRRRRTDGGGVLPADPREIPRACREPTGVSRFPSAPPGKRSGAHGRGARLERDIRRELARAISKAMFSRKLGAELRMLGKQLRPSSFQVINVLGGMPRVLGVSSPNSYLVSHCATLAGEEEISWPRDLTFVSRGWAMLAGGRDYDPTGGSSPGFSGFWIDGFRAVMTTGLHYKVDYEDVPSSEVDNMTSRTSDGVMESVSSKRLDAIMGNVITIRYCSGEVNSTLPYAEAGIWMLVQTEQDESVNGWIFLHPLETDLWVGSLAFFFFTAFAVWAIEQRTNPDFWGPPLQQYDTTLYVVFSTLVFAHMDRLRSNLSRFVVMAWVFVAVILASSYTANLASMLTVQRPKPVTVEGLLQDGVFVGYQRGSLVEDLLRKLNFDPSKMRAYDSREEYADALSKGSGKGGVAAIFDEMSYLSTFIANRCSDYRVLGPVVNSEGFRLPGSSEITCKDKNSGAESHRLSFKSFSGLFIVSGAVSAAALLVFLGKYVCQNWEELRALSPERPLWRRVAAWASHYVRMDPAVVSGGDEPPVLGHRGGAVAVAEEAVDPPPAACGSSASGGCALGREGLLSSSTDESASSATPAMRPPSIELTLIIG